MEIGKRLDGKVYNSIVEISYSLGEIKRFKLGYDLCEKIEDEIWKKLFILTDDIIEDFILWK